MLRHSEEFIITFRKDKAMHFWEGLDKKKKGPVLYHAKSWVPLQVWLYFLFFFFFNRVHNSLLLVICGNMSAKRFLGEMCCRVLRDLCSYVTLLLLQQKVWKKWSLVAHTGFKLSALNRGLDIPSYSYWLLTRNAPEGHPCIFMLFVGKVWQMRYSTVSALVASCYFSSSSVSCLLELAGDQDSYSQVDDQEKNVHWWCHEDRSAEMWMCPAGLWTVYAVTLTHLLPRDFLMSFGIGHVTPGSSACVSEVMSKHP